jgi:hypothetical protein
VRERRVLAHDPEDSRTIGTVGTRIHCARDGCGRDWSADTKFRSFYARSRRAQATESVSFLILVTSEPDPRFFNVPLITSFLQPPSFFHSQTPSCPCVAAVIRIIPSSRVSSKLPPCPVARSHYLSTGPRASVVHMPHGVRAHPRPAVPFVVAASLVLP